MNVNSNPVGKRCLAVLAALCLVSLIAHLALFPALPEVVPTHFGVSGEVDGWSDKRMALLLDALPLVLLGLFWLVPRIDPRGEAYAKSGRVYQGFVTLFTLFMVAMTWTTEAAALGWLPSERAVGLAVPVLVGVMLLALGNYLPRVSQNYTFGIKTPWALEDAENWRRTQRFGGVCFMVCGLAFIAEGVMDLGAAGLAASLALTVGAGVACCGYSYLLWRRSR